ncbi:ABC transporter permease subunit [Paenibacillus sp. MBLB4367]|uniref:ABC transporter permease subunit n=1 Tax=Paenibacillus sp. MBLB4367 TaxID=3384767 RepID=UPI0039082215
MRSFQAGLINELLLLMYRKKMIAFLIISACIPVILALSLHALQPILGLVAVSQSFPVQMLGMYTAFWIPLFIFVTAADLFPNETASRTLKLALLRPITRFRVYAAKTAALVIGIGVLLAVLGAVTLVCGLFAGAAGSGSDWLGTGKAYLAAFFAMSALASVFVFFSQFFKSAGSAIIGSIVLYGAAKLAPFFAGSVSVFSPASYTDWHLLWLSPVVSGSKLAVTSLLLASGCILFLSLGYSMFDRKEA